MPVTVGAVERALAVADEKQHVRLKAIRNRAGDSEARLQRELQAVQRKLDELTHRTPCALATPEQLPREQLTSEQPLPEEQRPAPQALTLPLARSLTVAVLGPSADGLSFAHTTLAAHSQALTGGFECLQGLPQLTSVDVSFNLLTTLEGLEHLPYLCTIRARGNRLTSVLDFAAPPSGSQLRRADLCHNWLSTWSCAGAADGSPSKPIGTAAHSKLDELLVDENQLTTLEGVASLGGLRLLSAAHNRLEDRALIPLSGSQLLATLNLSHNQLSALPNLAHVPLTHVDLSHNRLEDVHNVVEALGASTSRIRSLSLDGNEPLLVQLNHQVFAYVPHAADIQTLRLYRSALARTLPALQVLDGIPLSVGT